MGAKKIVSGSEVKLPPEFENIVPHLKKFGVFSELKGDDEALEHLKQHLVPAAYPQGSEILTEGVADDTIFFLLKGSVEIFKTTGSGDRFKVAEVNDTMHSYFGEGAILESHARTATIVAAEPSLCLKLSRGRFEQYCSEYPAWGLPILLFIAKKTAQRLRAVGKEFVFLYHAYVREIRGK